MPTLKYLLGTTSTVLDTGLNSLANNSNALSAEFDNTAGQTGDGYVEVTVEFAGAFAASPAASTGVSVWLLRAIDGTNYEDGDSSTTPARAPDLVLPVRAVSTAQRVAQRTMMPAGKFKVLLRNDGTGQALASSGNTLKIRPITYQT